jgi:uncharacterized protein YcfJ
MKHFHVSKAAFILIGLLSLLAQAQERAKVISSRPLIQQIIVPQQICGPSPLVVAEPKTGAGAVLGAIAGGAVGSAIGQGGGNAAATALGIVGGAVAGDAMEGQASRVQNITTCSVQMVSKNITVYNVEYEYAGKRYFVQMPNDPGKFLPINISPMAPEGQVTIPQPGAYDAGTFQPSTVMTYPSGPSPVYVQPYPAPYPYGYPPPYGYGYLPFPFSFHFGFAYHGAFRRR